MYSLKDTGGMITGWTSEPNAATEQSATTAADALLSTAHAKALADARAAKLPQDPAINSVPSPYLKSSAKYKTDHRDALIAQKIAETDAVYTNWIAAQDALQTSATNVRTLRESAIEALLNKSTIAAAVAYKTARDA